MNEATPSKSTELQVFRETVESLAVAFILALLFKAFIAEAFVIPTGSMAPTLMGAHKDIRCEECGYQYQCGASDEFNDVGSRSDEMVIATTCPLCRKPQVANPEESANHSTFSGDRILVSKLAYAWNKPQRWDVIVFKFIQDARLNYIKRCIGRPNETIRIRGGNIYVRQDTLKTDATKADSAEAFQIARKPPHVMNAMLQILYDSKYVPKSLVKAGRPSQWQPFPAEESKWQVTQTESKWSASITDVPAGSTHWLRYYHHVVDPLVWDSLRQTGILPNAIPPRSSRLITDFTAYNARFSTFNTKMNKNDFRPLAESFISSAIQRGISGDRRNVPLEYDGMHWIGDLAADFEFKTERETKSLALLLVEAGVEHECRIDLKTGLATAVVKVNGNIVEAFQSDGNTLSDKATAFTKVRAGGKHRIRFANVDDTLVLWVDGTPVKWTPSGNLLSDAYLPINNRIPRSTASNPLDSAPIAVGVEGGAAEIVRSQVYRDIYYIAHGEGYQLSDYSDFNATLRQSTNPENNERYAREVHNLSANELTKKMSIEGLNRNAMLSNPNLWACGPLAEKRQEFDFTLEKDWYFPMGDNSAASSDARSWSQHHAPERLFIGRAVMVFWPHYWNAPVPFLPNFQRMGLIR